MYTPEQQREHRRGWIWYLRSGRYEQGKKYLRRRVDGVNEFCCLGVACDISNLGDWSENGEHPYYKLEEDLQNNLVLMPEMQDFYGLATADGRFNVPGVGEKTLASLNDDGTSFEVIAMIIELEPEGLLAE